MDDKLKKAGSVQLEPVEGEAFDIRPSKEGIVRRPTRGRFFGWGLTFVFIAFFSLALFSFYTFGRASFQEHYDLATEGYQAFSAAIDSAKSGEFDLASDFLIESQKAFEELAEETEFLRNQTLPSTDQGLVIEAMDLLLLSALEASDLGLQMIEFARPLEGEIRSKLENIQSPEFGPEMIEYLHQKKASLEGFRAQMNQIQTYLNNVNTTFLPEELRLKIDQVKMQTALVDDLLTRADDLLNGALKLLGDRVPNKVVMLFQNNRELRPTGGFAGSFGQITIDDGILGEIVTQDIYHYANQLGGDLFKPIPAPPGLDRLNSDFTLQDANYSPDLLTSAQDFRYLLESARGPSFDTFVTIDPTVAEMVLRESGNEIVLEELTLNADDLMVRLMYYIEGKIIDPADPKGILFQLIPEFRRRVENLDRQILQAELIRLIKGRHIQITSFDPQVRSLLELLGIDGGMPLPVEGQDFLATVTTSVSANKSDGFIKSRFDHSTNLIPGQPIQNTLSITKTHTWGPEEDDFWGRWMESYGSGDFLSKQALMDILGKGLNQDYLRIYVPAGSQLRSSTGIDMDQINTIEELGYTVFTLYFKVAAGQTNTITLNYELPQTFDPDDLSYGFLARKQAGLVNATLKKTLSFDEREIGDSFEGAFVEDVQWQLNGY